LARQWRWQRWKQQQQQQQQQQQLAVGSFTAGAAGDSSSMPG
jgi:hypothetical protein